jgi:hypothetical protein
MDHLSNETLLASYKEALKLNLNEDFVALFETELAKRNLLAEIQKVDQ